MSAPSLRGACLALGLLLAAPGPASTDGEPDFAEVTAGVEEPLPLPTTRAKVAYRTSRKGAPGRRSNLKGDLTLTAEAIELVTEEQTIIIPLDEVRVLSFGKVRGDVDTDWALLSLGRPVEAELVGFKDGRRLGFAVDSREVYELLRRYVRQQGAAQYDVPDGWVVWDPLHRQVTLAVPEGWHAWTAGMALGEGPERWGTVRFSRDEVRPGRRGRAVPTGSTGFSLTLEEAPPGAACEDGFSSKARARLLDRVLDGWRESGLSVGAEAVEIEPWRVDGCAGLGLAGEGRTTGGETVPLEVRVVTHHRTLYRFDRRGETGAGGPGKAEVFRRMLETVRFTVGL